MYLLHLDFQIQKRIDSAETIRENTVICRLHNRTKALIKFNLNLHILLFSQDLFGQIKCW